MTLLEILLLKEERLSSVPDELAGQSDVVQRSSLKYIIRLLDEMEKDGEYLVLSVGNLSRIQSISQLLSDFIFNDTEYSGALTQFAREFNTQAAYSRDYIHSIEDTFIDKEIYQQSLISSQRQAVDLLARSGVEQVFINPVKQALQAAITSQASFADTISSLSDIAIGTKEKEGAIVSNVKRVAYDAFAFADRQYIKVISDDLGFEWFQYFGGLIKDSRCFCATRSNKFFHRTEIEHWGKTPSLWDKQPGCSHGGGRILETTAATIWTYAGGYNCRHQIVPAAVSSVPQKDLLRITG